MYVPAGLLAGVLGMKLLGFVRTEGLAKGLPLKLLLMVELLSELLRLGFAGLVDNGEEDLFEDIAI